MDTGALLENFSAVNTECFPMAFASLLLENSRIRLLFANSLFYQVIGYSPEEYEALASNEHGFRLVGDEYAQSLVQCMRERLPRMDLFSLSMELNTRNGESRNVRANILKTRQEDGIYELNCAFEDMEDVGAAFHGYVQKMDRLDTVVSISANTIFEYSSIDKSLQIFTNEGGRFSEKTVITEDFEQLFKENGCIYEDDTDSFEQLCDNIRSGLDRAAFELRLSDGGDFRWYRIKMKTIKDDAYSDRFKVIGKFEDVSDMKNAEQRLIDKAERDPLTHIYNKATTKKLIKNYLRTDSRETFGAFIIIDVDDFKSINDTFGHLFGDSILVDLSQEMQDLFRSNDVVGRIGGDEFIVYLRGLKHLSHVENKAKDICKIFDLLYDEDGRKITGSLGIALFPRDGDTFDELYKRADSALYTSKRAGKSCYTFYDKSKDTSELPALPRVEQYHCDMDFLKQSADFESSLIEFALDISEEKVDMGTVRSIFEKVGKHFNLSRVTVYVRDAFGVFAARDQWCGKNVALSAGAEMSFSDEEFNLFAHSFDKNMIAVSENTAALSGAADRFFSEQGTRAYIASGRLSGGVPQGFVAFEECVTPRVWSIEEARAADVLKKLYFDFILRIFGQ